MRKNRTVIALLILPLLLVLSPAYPAVGNVVPQERTAGNDLSKDDLSKLEEELDSGQANEEMLRRLSLVLENDGENARAHYVLGRFYDARGFQGLADDEYRLADELDPATKGRILKQFEQWVEREQVGPARSLLRYTSDRFPDHPGVLLMQAQLLLQKGKIREAEAKLTRALASSRCPPGARSALAGVRGEQGRWAEALVLAEAVLSRNPEHLSANLQAGTALLRTGRAAEAALRLQRAYNKNPMDNVVASRLSLAYQGSGRPAEALAVALHALAVETNATRQSLLERQISRLLASVSAEKLPSLVAAVERRLESPQWSGRLNLLLGRILESQGRQREALKRYMAGLEADPDSAELCYAMAANLERAGDYYFAFQSYQQALRLKPHNHAAADRLERLVNRLNNRPKDVSWQLKDWLHQRNRGRSGSA